ncbi:MAG: DUF2490 domain-containing protein [Chitinophagaceae bacterium]|nr:DUF2490 domain-containing protein [Chitinophagaceae bacterium]
MKVASSNCRRILSKAILVMALFIVCRAGAQTDGLGTWNVISGKMSFSKNWNAYFEAQLRSQQFVHDFSYYEYKGGIGYNFPTNGSILAAIGHYVTYQPEGDFKDPKINDEFRIWEQFVLNNNIGRLKLEHRYRIEQRFTSAGYRNRFRYRLNALLPFHHRVIEAGTWYASVFNEIFVTNEGPYFEQNRIFGGFGYQFNDRLTILGGLINRFDNSGTVQTWKNYLQLNFIFTLAEFKSGRERHPSALD